MNPIDTQTLREINRLLKPHGLRLRQKVWSNQRLLALEDLAVAEPAETPKEDDTQ